MLFKIVGFLKTQIHIEGGVTAFDRLIRFVSLLMLHWTIGLTQHDDITTLQNISTFLIFSSLYPLAN